ncbi:MAG: glycosyl-4,4'-diaponeurosporenoate acyltransferase [bacterium]
MLIELPVHWIIIIDVMVWFIVHMSVSYLITLVPKQYINIDAWIYRERKWEDQGRLYEKVFKIKKWKDMLPDGAALFRKGFRKKRLTSVNKEYLHQFILEVCRAESAHWIVILFSPLFFLWNYWWAGIIMILYALIANIPCILAQRYNRIRFKRILNKMSTA